jgi:hypothetical protein
VIFDKVTATGKGAVKLAVSAVVCAVAAGFVILAPQWSIDHAGHWAKSAGHGIAAGGGWIAGIVHHTTN